LLKRIDKSYFQKSSQKSNSISRSVEVLKSIISLATKIWKCVWNDRICKRFAIYADCLFIICLFIFEICFLASHCRNPSGIITHQLWIALLRLKTNRRPKPKLNAGFRYCKSWNHRNQAHGEQTDLSQYHDYFI
jgi:hypothetical protein